MTSLPRLDWFDVLDMENRPVLTEREILKNLQAIVTDADELPVHEVCMPQVDPSSMCSSFSRLPEIRLVCSQPRIEKIGLPFARPF